jgi:protein HOOK3
MCRSGDPNFVIRQKSEDNLAMAESELDKQTTLVTDLTRKVDELQVQVDEAAKLKDQVDE